MTLRTSHRAALAAAGTSMALATLAGCGGNGLQTSGQGGSSVPSASSPSPAASSTRAPSPSPAAPASRAASPSPAAPPACAAGDIAVALQVPDGGGAAGSQYLLLTFRNTSRSTCTMNGHPGVSFVGKHDGTQIGRPAARQGSLRTVTLSPGELTTALLQVADAGNYDPATCVPTTSDGFRVYPPDSRVSAFVPYRTEACQGDTGSSPQLSVSAVGH